MNSNRDPSYGESDGDDGLGQGDTGAHGGQAATWQRRTDADARSNREATARELEASNQQDLDWVRRTLAGDSKAYDQLYLKHRDRVVASLFQVLRHRDDSLEATQEVFLKAYRALGRFQPDSRFFPWLYRIAVNHGIDRLRRRKARREQSYEPFNRVVEDPSRSPFQSAAWGLHRREIASAIDTVLDQLAEKHREVFVLFSYEEKNYAQIAEILGIPIGTVMSRLFYARRKLRAALPSEWDPGGRRRRDREGTSDD